VTGIDDVASDGLRKQAGAICGRAAIQRVENIDGAIALLSAASR
jgi:hypothetical protein